MADIWQELLEAIDEQDYQRQIENNKELQKLMKKIEKKHPSYEDVLEYADVLGECLSNAIKNNVSGSVLPDGKMYYNIAKTVLEPMLKENYEKVIEHAWFARTT
ncbi:MAG: hypothetical protein LUF92_09320 [Clostridiales bacterium]|nr:hypothetical protein [Clostridiales bacterium]